MAAAAFLAVLVVSSLCFIGLDGWSCVREPEPCATGQNYGIRGVVKNETANRTEQTRVYAVAVNATLWGDIILLNTCNLSVFKPGHMVNIWTAYDTAACGVALMVGVEYVITGYKSRMNRLSMDRCTSFIKRWDKTSPSERKTLGVCSAGSGVGLPSMLGLAFVVILLEWIY